MKRLTYGRCEEQDVKKTVAKTLSLLPYVSTAIPPSQDRMCLTVFGGVVGADWGGTFSVNWSLMKRQTQTGQQS